MSELSTIARPYAQAIFELAKHGENFDMWSDALSLLKNVTTDEQLQNLVDDPFTDKSKLGEIVHTVCGNNIDQQAHNLIQILIDNGRLAAVGEISMRFEILRAQAESVIEADVETAFTLDQDQLDKLNVSLEKHFDKKVKLSTRINEDLIGGVLIRAGDTVIDGSIRTKLEKLTSTIRA